MSECLFPEVQAQTLLREWQKTGNIDLIDDICRLCQPTVQKLISVRQTFLFLPREELESYCLEQIARRLMSKKYNAERGRLYTYIQRIAECVLITRVRRETKWTRRMTVLDEPLENSLHTDGEDSRHVVDHLLHVIAQIRTPFTKENEKAASRWLTRNLVESNFTFWRWDAANAMGVVFALSPSQSRQIYDSTVLEIRRVCLSEHRTKPVTGFGLRGTRDRSLLKYKARLSPADFSKLCILMHGLAPRQLIDSGLYSLDEILHGLPRGRVLFEKPADLLSGMSEPHYSAPVQFSVEPVKEKALSPAPEIVQSPNMPVSASSHLTLESRAPSPSRSVAVTEKPRIDLSATMPAPLLAGSSQTEFGANLRDLERTHKRPYSLTRAITETMQSGGPTSLVELEADQELRSWTDRGKTSGSVLIPLEALDYRQRDLDAAGTGQAFVPTVVESDVIPFLRNKTVVGRMGGTFLSGLTPGSHNLSRETASAGASWYAETGSVAPTSPLFDTVSIVPHRLEAQCRISRMLLRQSAPAIDKVVADDIRRAIAVAVDAAVLNGSGVDPVPTGILQVPANPASTYAYTKRAPDVANAATAPTWPLVLEFFTNLEAARVDLGEDSSAGFVTSPDVRTLWQQTEVVTGFPTFIWASGPDEFGRVNGIKAASTYNMPQQTAICGRWSDVLVCTWQGVELLTDPYTYAGLGLVLLRVSLLVDVVLRYSSAFCVSNT
jgi:HK97 family phage major capsid protein